MAQDRQLWQDTNTGCKFTARLSIEREKAMSRQRTMEKILTSEYVTIGELARLTGCRYSTLKFYTEEGMLPFEQPEQNLTRRYRREESVARVEWIRAMRESGKTVPEIKEILR